MNPQKFLNYSGPALILFTCKTGIIRGKTMRKYILISILAVGLVAFSAGCGKKNAEPPPVAPDAPRVARQDIKPTPTEVVTDYLKAIKSENYSKAYKYVNAPYTDKQGFINQMTNTLADNDFSLLDFRILATQIYDRTSTVVAELNTKLKSPKTGSLIDLTQKSQYSLGLFEDKWLITAGNCIEGCVEEEPVIEVIE